MHDSISYYKKQRATYKAEVSKLSKQLISLSIIRLFIFITVIIAVYFTINNWQLAAFIASVGVVLFIYLLLKYSKIKAEYRLKKELVVINEDEIKIRLIVAKNNIYCFVLSLMGKKCRNMCSTRLFIYIIF